MRSQVLEAPTGRVYNALMKRTQNTAQKMEALLRELQEKGEKPRLLLHSCCGPCSSSVLEYLLPYFRISVFYYNPNIYPREEYEHRKREQLRLIQTIKDEAHLRVTRSGDKNASAEIPRDKSDADGLNSVDSTLHEPEAAGTFGAVPSDLPAVMTIAVPATVSSTAVPARKEPAGSEAFCFNFPFVPELDTIDADYDPEHYFAAVKGLENEKEGGARCSVCFRLRLARAADVAAAGAYDFFATTLTVSPYKNAPLINAIGEEEGERARVAYLASDFKKKNGALRSNQLSKAYGLYRQDYCGCAFSRPSQTEPS